MIIVGAKGLAKEVLEIFAQQNRLENIVFFDDVSKDLPAKLFDRFLILRSVEEARIFFDKGERSFTLGLGNPFLRFQMQKKLSGAGGLLTSAISPRADIGTFGNLIGQGCTILSGTVITNGVAIGKGCLINPHCSISHDTTIGDFVEMSPGARVTGHCAIGDYTTLGTNSVILPRVKVGKNVIVGAGAVVTRDVLDNTLVVGIPAQEKRRLQTPDL
ncbi:MAG TPA: acetyltransferase [Ohtaekwangia sp.]|nr:acetyltransferase [Ohtaekwangia sp.]